MRGKSKRLAKKILLVGWGSADWKIIDPLIEAGKLPTIKKLIEAGTKAAVSGYDPPILASSWNTVFTGKVPFNHKICNFSQDDRGSIEPISSKNRKAKTIWQILSDYEFKTHQIGAWASHPAEEINGISISNLFPYFTKEDVSNESIFPSNQKDRFRQFLFSSEDLESGELANFVSIKESQNEDSILLLNSLKDYLAQLKSIHACAKEILQN